MSTDDSGQPPGTLEQKALANLRANVRSGWDPKYRTHYSYVMPSPGRYEWQWFWDSCFHAIALSRLDPEMAKQELRTLVATQRSDGFIGHLNYWGRKGALLSALYMQSRAFAWRGRRSAMIQPPFLAQAVERVFENSGDEAFLAEMLPRTQAYYDWLHRVRDPFADGLIAIISPFESGMDNSPVYDEAMGIKRSTRMRWLIKNRLLDLHNLVMGRNWNFDHLRKRDKFIMFDPFVNAVYADGLATLSRLHAAAGNRWAAGAAMAAAERTTKGLNTFCWDRAEERYVYLWGRNRKWVRKNVVGSIAPMAIAINRPDRVKPVVERHLLNPDEYWTHLPVPTVAADEPSFDPIGEEMIWRGAVCMNVNWFIARGLRTHGYDDQAEELARRSREAVERDFREFYSPTDGHGMRGTNFGWATAAVDM